MKKEIALTVYAIPFSEPFFEPGDRFSFEQLEGMVSIGIVRFKNARIVKNNPGGRPVVIAKNSRSEGGNRIYADAAEAIRSAAGFGPIEDVFFTASNTET